MVKLIRFSSPVLLSRLCRSACLAVGFALLVSTAANAALREYRVRFQQSSSASAAGYTLHVGPDAGSYSQEFDLGARPDREASLIYAVDLEDSIDLFIAVRAYDVRGVQSAFSNEIRVEAIPPPPPAGDGGDTSTGGDTSGGDTSGDTSGDTGGDTSGGDTSGDTGGDTSGGDTSGGEVAGLIDDRFSVGLSTTSDGLIKTVLGDGSLESLTMDSLAAKENIRPVRCDLDADGDRDLVIGFGSGSGGQVAVIFLEDDVVSSISTITAGPEAYRTRSGRTNPACGDLDGDGRAELVIGFGYRMRGVVQIFDDVQTDFSPLASAQSDSEGYMQVPVPDGFWGSTYPAIGNIDDDGLDELVVGLGRTVDGGRLVVLDDLSTGFGIHPGNRTGESWLRVDADPERKQRRTRTMPALGDLDGDGRDEIVVSFGRGSGARVALMGDAIGGFPMTSSDVFLMTTGRPTYQRKDGATRSAVGDADGDGIGELIVGFRRRGRHEVQVFEAMRGAMIPMIADGGFMSAANTAAVIIPTPVN